MHRLPALLKNYAQTPTQEIESQILKIIDPRIQTTARYAMGCGTVSPDQIQECRIAALEALRKYDPRRGSYVTLLALHVRKALYRRRKPLVHIPEQQRILLGRLNTLEAEHLFAHDCLPTDDAICASLAISSSTLETLRRAQSADNVIMGDPEPQPEPADLYERADTGLDVSRALKLLAKSNPKAALAARSRYLQDMSIQNIAALLRLRYSTVQQLLAEAEEFLRQQLEAYKPE